MKSSGLVADLLVYPDESHERRLLDALEASKSQPRLSRSLQAYRDETAHLSLGSIKEIYSATFELNPANTLDSSFHIYDGELPDYLPVVLNFIATLDDHELRKDFCANYLIPSLARLQDSLGKTASPHRHLVDAVYCSVDDLSNGGL